MSIVRVTKEFDFEASHALDGYDGKCKDIHGHSYHMMVRIKGTPITDDADPKRGMVIDFSDLKKIVGEQIVKPFDHALILKSDSRFKGIEQKNERVQYVDYQPTCENMVIDFAERIKAQLPAHIELHSVFLRETNSSYAEWYASDNP